MEKEEQILVRHYQDLSRVAWNRNIHTYTDFLNMNEQSLLEDHKRELSVQFQLFGGREGCERQIACFLADTDYDPSYPISCIKVDLPGAKFQTVSLTHRDYLGAILGLGVDRSKIGDIIVEDHGAYFFCISNIAPFLLDELRQIGRYVVQCSQVEPDQALGAPKKEEIGGTVSSCRLDSLIGVAFRTSRGISQELIESGRVYVNARLITSSHHQPAEGDIISVRGHGKFVFEGSYGQSRKGRIQIRLSKFI